MSELPARVKLSHEHPLAGMIEEFITELARDGKSPHTLRCYRADLTQLAHYHNGTTTEIDTDVLRGFFASIGHQAPATQARKQASIGAFLAWCQRGQPKRPNPMAGIARIVTRAPGRASPSALATPARATPSGRAAPATNAQLGRRAVISGRLVASRERAGRDRDCRVAQWVGDPLQGLTAAQPSHRADQSGWPAVVRAHLVELHRLAGGVVSLGVLIEGQVHYLWQLYNHQVPKTPSRSRRIAPAHATAIGKLLLAHHRDDLSSPVSATWLPAFTAYTIGDPRLLRVQLTGIRKTGLAFSRQEYAPGLACVAAPVRGHDGHMIAGLAVGDHVSRPADKLAMQHLRTTAHALSAALAHHGIGTTTDIRRQALSSP